MAQLTFDRDRVFQFFNTKDMPIVYSADLQGIGVERDGEIVGGVLFASYSKHNIFMHVAGTDGIQWATKSFVKSCFGYPFLQLGCDRISGWVEASNTKARHLDEHLGFKQEAILTGAARDGGDVIIYRMWKHECRFI